MDIAQESLRLHEQWQGKLDTVPKMKIETREDLALAYTPGVAEPCRKIAANPEDAYKYTMKANTVAVVSDGSAVLGLGNIGPAAAMPVMEGKCALFKAFGGVNAVPLCLDTQDVDEIVETVKLIAPSFGGINLEDISAPRCFEIERRLIDELDIPVFHDDQHGTAIVVLSGVINALRLTGKKKEDCRVAVNGETITQMGTQVEEGDVVTLDGQVITPEEEKRYILYHKPAGEVTTVSDDKGRETVMDRFADFPVRLYPVGRLDYDSEGLLLLTNDGELAQRLTHPSCEVDKVYLARVTGNPSNEALDKLRRGVYMEGDERRTYPAQVRVVRDESLFSDILVTIHEGRNRQVRRMFDSVGHKVLLLRRVRFGPLDLGDLRRGEWRELNTEEIAKLKAL